MTKKKEPMKNLYQIAFHPEPGEEIEMSIIAADSFEVLDDQVRFYYNEDDSEDYETQELIAVFREWKFVRIIGKTDELTEDILKAMLKDKPSNHP